MGTINKVPSIWDISLLTFCQFAVAQVTDIRFVPIDNTEGGPMLDGFVTIDMHIDITGPYIGSEIFLELDQGNSYQNTEEVVPGIPMAGTTPPHPALVEQFPAARFDTFVTLGGPTSVDIIGGPSALTLGAGAVGLRGSVQPQFDTQVISQGWHGPRENTPIRDLSDFMIARLTLSEDAAGKLSYRGSANGVITHQQFGVFDILNAPQIPGDYDGDDFVGQADLDVLLRNWGTTTRFDVPTGWISNIPFGHVGQRQLDPLILNWGNSAASLNRVALPEPGTVFLMATSLIMTACLWHRGRRYA